MATPDRYSDAAKIMSFSLFYLPYLLCFILMRDRFAMKE
jgi:hypothetical protein